MLIASGQKVAQLVPRLQTGDAEPRGADTAPASSTPPVTEPPPSSALAFPGARETFVRLDNEALPVQGLQVRHMEPAAGKGVGLKPSEAGSPAPRPLQPHHAVCCKCPANFSDTVVISQLI